MAYELDMARCQCGHRAYDHLGRGRCNEGTRRCHCCQFRAEEEKQEA